MSVTGSSEHRHQHDSVFYGLVNPLDPQGNAVVPQPGDLWIVTPLIAVVAGTPGSVTPASELPADLAAIQGEGALGQLAHWKPGEYITLVDASETYWNGTTWEAGRAPDRLVGATAGTPGQFVSALAANPVVGDPMVPQTLGDLNVFGALGNTAAWAPAEYIEIGVVGAVIQAHWNGTAWALGSVPLLVATTVTAGTPGTFGPVGTRPPATLTELQTITPAPATVWQPGEYVTVGGTDYYWNGTNWATGQTPAAHQNPTGATQGAPGAFTPASTALLITDIPATLAALVALGNLGQTAGTAWATPGHYVVLGDGSEAYWDGNTFTMGRVPVPHRNPTGVTAGAPGAFTPATQAGVIITDTPATLAALNALAIGSGAAWTTVGNYVTLGDASEAYWNGTTFVVGKVPAPTPITGVTFPTFPAVDVTFVGNQAPSNFASLQTLGNLGQTSKWPAGWKVTLGDGSAASWDGSAWVPSAAHAWTAITAGSPSTPTPANTGAMAGTLATLRFWQAQGFTLGQTLGTPWTQNQFVGLNPAQTVRAYWDGTTWQNGNAPAAAPAPVQAGEGIPGSFGPPGCKIPDDLAALNVLGRLGNTLGTPWATPGAHVVLADNSEAHWDGTNWIAGRVFAPPPTLPAAGLILAAGPWNNGNAGPASTTDVPSAVVMQNTGNDQLWIAWNEVANPATYRPGHTRIEVLNAAKTAVIYTSGSTAGNRIGGASVPGFQYGVTPVRITMLYLDGTTYVIDVTT